MALLLTALPTVSAEERRFGDVNGDGFIDVFDALEILKYFADMPSVIEKGNEEYEIARAITGGDKLTIKSALEIMRAVAGMTSSFGDVCVWCGADERHTHATCPVFVCWFCGEKQCFIDGYCPHFECPLCMEEGCYGGLCVSGDAMSWRCWICGESGCPQGKLCPEYTCIICGENDCLCFCPERDEVR
jgi:hypothetical protein